MSNVNTPKPPEPKQSVYVECLRLIQSLMQLCYQVTISKNMKHMSVVGAHIKSVVEKCNKDLSVEMHNMLLMEMMKKKQVEELEKQQ